MLSTITLGDAVLALQLSSHNFKDMAACLGPQVATVLDDLIALPQLSGASWYAAAFDMIWPEDVREALQAYAANQPVPIADIASFIPLVRKVGQFLDGVIFAIPARQPPLVAAEFLTADGPIEKLVANAIVQVCAFDTCCIEIGTDDEEIIQRMQLRFGGEIAEDAANG